MVRLEAVFGKKGRDLGTNEQAAAIRTAVYDAPWENISPTPPFGMGKRLAFGVGLAVVRLNDATIVRLVGRLAGVGEATT